MKLSLFLFLALAWRAAADPGDVAPAAPVIPGTVFRLTDFGAVADGKTDNRAAIGRAVDAVKAAGGGRIVVPAGTYFTGPFVLCSRCELHLDAGARLIFSQNFDDYPRVGTKRRPMLGADKAHDIAITGSGTIDGQGRPWWVVERKAKTAARARGLHDAEIGRPHLVVFSDCQRVRLEGITLTNSPMYNFAPARCVDVAVVGISIREPADSPNTDGIDPSACSRVLVDHCRIANGDDAIALKGRNGPCRDILVTDCDFSGGHGASIGSETVRGISHFTVRRCTFEHMTIGVRLKSGRDRGGLAQDILYEDLRMRDVQEAIVITSYYYDLPKVGQHDPAQPVTSTTPYWKNVLIRHVTAAGSRSAGMIVGLPEAPATGITLEDVDIRCGTGLRLSYVNGVTLKKVRIDPDRGEALILGEDVSGLVR